MNRTWLIVLREAGVSFFRVGVGCLAAWALLVMVTSFVLGSACTHQQAWVASGESIAALGTAYDATGHAMDAALDAKAITPEQYRKWAAFCHYYRPIYDLARDRWLNADATAAEHSAAVLASLSAELAVYTAMTAKGGAP